MRIFERRKGLFRPWVAPRGGGYSARYLTPEERAELWVGPPYDENYPPPPPPGPGAVATGKRSCASCRHVDTAP